MGGDKESSVKRGKRREERGTRKEESTNQQITKSTNETSINNKQYPCDAVLSCAV
jgi:hypothetical protein